MPEPHPLDINIVGVSFAAMAEFRADEPSELQPEFDAYGQALEGMLNRTYDITYRRAIRPKNSSKIQRAIVTWSPPGELPVAEEEAYTQLVLKKDAETMDVATRKVYFDTGLQRIATLPGAGVLFDPYGEGGQLTVLARNSRGRESERKVQPMGRLNRNGILAMNARIVYLATTGAK
jgi:hypothetical protein